MDTTLSQPTGQLLDGRYLVESRLAQGGMATVYLGRDVRLDRVVALKIARAELAGDHEFVRRFITEARAAAQLSSPNVVAVFDQGSVGDINYIAMEYVPGQTLRDVLREHGALSVMGALDITEGVLTGLSAAHRAGIIHRDVKPENVLLGPDGVIKVADFGLARAAAAMARTNTSGMIIGTAAYLAPEQVSASSSDARTDVYAAGVMLFEMLTGTQPHRGDSPLDTAYKHVNEVVPPPSSRMRGLPLALDALVALATSRDPDLRPADAGQFLEAVSEVRHDILPPLRRRGAHAARSEPQGGGLAGRDPAARDPYSRERPSSSPMSGPPAVAGPAVAGLAAAGSLDDTDLGPAVTGSGGYGAGGFGPGRQADLPSPGRHAGGSNTPLGAPVGGAPAPGAPAGLGPADPGHDQANHTLVVSAGALLPGFDEDSYQPRDRRLLATEDRWDREPPLQRLLFSRRLIYVLGGLAAVLAVILIAWWLAAGRYTTMPRVTGLAAGVATTELKTLHFQVQRGPGQHSNVPSGRVLSTSPAPGSKVRKGATITIVVSLGPVLVDVPPVTGQPIAQADDALKAKGLIPGPPKGETSPTIPAGVVISTDPVAGTAWPKNKPVGIVVSSGQPLPNFVGQQLSAAQAAAAAGGYKIQPVTVPKSSQPANTILRQTPAANSAIQAGEVVTVYVSPGPPTANVPNVTGDSLQQAEQALTAAGFKVTVQKHGPGNIVTGYGPSGTQPTGTTITIAVGFSFF
jgi:serine/threonine-protein kinase